MRRGGQDGQALLLVVGGLLLVAALAVVAGAAAWGFGDRADDQRTVDLAALVAARVMAERYADVHAPVADGTGGLRLPPGALGRDAYLALAARAAAATARDNEADTRALRVTFPDAGGGTVPLRVAVRLDRSGDGPDGRDVRAVAEAVPPATAAVPGAAGAGQYTGPLAYRDGRPMRPDVALAYDRLRAAARRDGVAVVVVSGFRSDAEQAVLFARHPDPKWVAPPGRSLHRLGTELDLGPRSAYGWLARHARRFGFVQRYAWEPWHYGFVRNPGSTSVGYGGRKSARTARVSGPEGEGSDRERERERGGGGEGRAGGVLPAWVPARFRPAIIRAAQRWNVGAVLLAAQLQVESGFNPAARSGAGAQGIAQFMPGTARQYGLRDPFDAAASIDAQGHLMRDLLRDFGSVPLALAAYNAGPRPVRRCGCAGPYAETRKYVATILALILGTGDVTGLGAAQMTVRLVA